jgi:hypothetical protein
VSRDRPLDAEDLRALYESAIDDYWDATAHANVIAREHAERKQITDYVSGFASDG